MVNAVNNTGKTALMLVAERGNQKIVDLLKSHREQ